MTIFTVLATLAYIVVLFLVASKGCKSEKVQEAFSEVSIIAIAFGIGYIMIVGVLKIPMDSFICYPKVTSWFQECLYLAVAILITYFVGILNCSVFLLF